ncbi:MAG: PAS domain S-box protein, partial [Planctomycetota bacterium]
MTERKTPETKASIERNTLQAILGAMQDGITIRDLDYTLTYQNKASMDLFGDRTGEKCYRVFQGIDRVCDGCPVELAFKDGQSHSSIRKAVLPSGEISYWENVANPIRDSCGNIVSCLEINKNITERKRQDVELLLQKQRLEDVTNSARCGLMLLDAETRIIYANSLAEKWFGPIEQIGGKCCCKILNVDRTKCAAWELLETGETAEGEVFEGIIDGEQRFFYTVASPAKASDGQTDGITLAILDISELKKAEDLLSRQRDSLNALMDNMPDAIYFKDASSRFTKINDAHAKVLGLEDAHEAVGKTDSYFFSPQVAQNCLEDEQSIVKSGRPVIGKIEEVRMADGKESLWFSATKVPIADKEGRVTGIVGISRDITEQKRIEDELKKSEAAFRNVFDNTLLGLYRTTPDGRILMANSAVLRMLGYTSFEEVAARNLEEGGFEAGYPRSLFKQRIEADGQIVGLESAWTRHDGTTLFVRESAKAVRDAEGNTLYYEGTVEDITEQKKFENELRKSEAAFRNVFDNTLLGLYRTTPDGRILMANPAILRMLGYESLDDLTERNLEEAGFEAAYSRSLFKQRIEADGQIVGLESAWTRSDGTTLFVRESAKAVRDSEGNILYYEGTVEDITERKNAEEKLLYRLAFEHLIMGISADLVHLGPLEIDAGITDAITSVGKFARVDRAYVFQFRDDGQLLDNTHDWCAPEIEPHIESLQGIVLNDELPWFASKIRSEEVFHIPSVDKLPAEAEREKEHFQRQDIKSLIVIPMRSGDRLTGFIGFDSVKSEKEWPQDIIDLVRITGQTISSSLIRNKAETALKESEEKYRSLITNIPDVTWTTDSQGSTTFISRNVEKVYGYSAEEICTSGSGLWFERIHPDDNERVRKAFNALFEKSAEYDIEYRIKRKDGEWIWLRDRSIATYEKDGACYADGIFTDITAHRQAEGELRLSEEKYRLLADNATDIVWTADLDLQLTYVSPSVERVRGYSVEEAMAQTFEEMLTPSSIGPARELLAEGLAEEGGPNVNPSKVWTVELEVTHKNGPPIWTESTVAFIRDESGRPIGIRGSSRDITERKKAEGRFSTVVFKSPIPTAVGGTDGSIIAFNDALENLIGYRRSDVVDVEDWANRLYPNKEYREFVWKNIKQALAGEKQDCTEFTIRCKDGTTREVGFHTSCFEDCIIVQMVDITERKRAEEELRRQEERLELFFSQSLDGFFFMMIDEPV